MQKLRIDPHTQLCNGPKPCYAQRHIRSINADCFTLGMGYLLDPAGV